MQFKTTFCDVFNVFTVRNLILEYAIGSASIARGYSGYVDTLIDGQISKRFTEWAPLNFGTSKYFDFFAFAIALLIAGLKHFI